MPPAIEPTIYNCMNKQSATRLAHNSDQAGPRCVICTLPVTSSFAAHSYRLYTCDNCDFVFLEPSVAKSLRCEALFDDTYFRSGVAGYSNYFADATLLQEHGNRYGFTACEGWRVTRPRRWSGGRFHPARFDRGRLQRRRHRTKRVDGRIC
jgi:hypothetical protein